MTHAQDLWLRLANAFAAKPHPKTPDATERSYSAAQREGWARVAGYVEENYVPMFSKKTPLEPKQAPQPFKWTEDGIRYLKTLGHTPESFEAQARAWYPETSRRIMGDQYMNPNTATTPLSPSGTAEMRHAALPELPPWPRSEWIEKEADRTFWESERSISEWSALTFKPMVDARDARIAELERDASSARAIAEKEYTIAATETLTEIMRTAFDEAAFQRNRWRERGAELDMKDARITALESALRRARESMHQCPTCRGFHSKMVEEIEALLAKGETGSNDRADDMGSNTTCNQRPETVTRHDGHESREHASVRGSTPASPALTASDNDGQPCVVPNSDEARKRQVERAARTAKPSRDEAYAALYRVLIDTANIHPTSRAYMLVDAVLALQPNAPVDRSGEHPADSHAAATCGGSVADSPLVGAASVSGPIRKVEAGGDSTSPSVSATALLKHGAPGGAVGVASQESADRVVRSGPPVPTTPPRAEEWPTTPGAFKPHEMPPTVDVMRASTVCAMIEQYRTALDEARAELERLRAENAQLKAELAVTRENVPDFACLACGPVKKCDEERCCLSCGRDLVPICGVCGKTHACPLLDDDSEVKPAPAAPPQPVTGEKWSEEQVEAARSVCRVIHGEYRAVQGEIEYSNLDGALEAIAKVAHLFAPRAATPTRISEEALEKMCKTYWERDGLQIKWEMLNESTREYQRKDMRAALASLGIEVGGEIAADRSKA